MMRKRSFFCGSLLAALVWSHPAKADNDLHIPDNLYQVYNMATQANNPERQFALADSLYTLAEQQNDVKAKCMAVVVKMRHYYNQFDKEPLYACIDEVMKLAEKGKEDKYYFYAWALKGNYLKNKDQFYEAFQEAQAMKEKAEEMNSHYGMYSTLRLLANIYEIRHEYPLAIDNYQEAAKFADNPDDDLSPVLRAMGWCYLNMNQPEQAVECYKKSMETAASERSKKASQLQLCFALFKWEQHDAFESNYQEIMEYCEREGAIQKRYLPKLNALHYTIQRQYAQALKEAEGMDNPADVLDLQITVYKALGNYKKALELKDQLTNLNDSVMMKQHSENLAELDAAIGNSSLKMKADQLEKDQMHTQFTLMAIASILGIVMLLMLVYFLNKSRKMNARLNAANDILDKKNEELNKTNAELDRASEKAQESDSLKSHFLKHVTHEFRTPLNAIVGFSQILAEGAEDMDAEMRNEFVQNILNSSNELTQIINNMLDISLLSSNSIVLKHSKIRVNQLCQEIILLCQEKTPFGVTLRYEPGISENYILLSDPQRIMQILQNFISNSQKCTTEGEIVLSTDSRHGKLYFYVTDSGCGIPEEQMDNIFEMFQKVDDFKQGFGIGLTICKMMAMKLGGQIGIDREYKNGARFWFEI